MKKHNIASGLAGGLLITGTILIIVFFSGAVGVSANICIHFGCHNEKVPGSNFCEIHQDYADSLHATNSYNTEAADGGSTSVTNRNDATDLQYQDYGSTVKPSGNTTVEPSVKPSGNTNTKPSVKPSKNSTRTFNTLNNDPADYDDPEDYADDAWGDDFEDWGDAYDYWEDY